MMHALLAGFVGLVLSAPVVAEPLLEGIVRFASGEPAAAVRVRVFDMSDLQRGAVAQATTDPAGYFALPLSALAGRALPAGFTLGPNYPNPFNPSTIIPYQLAASSEVRLEVFNLLGQRVTTLVDGERPAGFHTAMWHATDAAGRAVGAGVYIYRLAVGAARQTGRMVLLDGQAGVSAVQAGSVLPEPASGEAPVYGLLVEGPGLVPYMDPAFRVAAGMAPVELVVSAGSYWSGKAAKACGLCGFLGDAATDSTALVALYEATDGDNWTNNTHWLSDRPLGEWHGVTTDADGRVTWLNLFANQLSGSIPPELGNLTNLTLLALSANQLSGSIPPELGNLTNLSWLNLSRNQLSGCVPEGLRNVEINDFSALGLPFCDPAKDGTTDSDAAIDKAALVVLYNAMDGDNWTNNTHWLSDQPLSEWYGVTTNADGRVSWLNLSRNQLSGSIPPELGNLTNLQRLVLSFNQLSGSMPPELGNLANLTELALSSNQLSGSIPPELGNLTNLQRLALGGNQLSGSIPPELGNLTNLTELALSSNQLSGSIPPELGNLTNLIELNLSSNQLSGSIPPELDNLTNLQRLALGGNQLSGSIPPELGNLANLTVLVLSFNQLSGSIPPELGNLTNLTELALSSNQLSGSIPPELGNLTNLQKLTLGGNQLSGSIPPELGNLTNLIVLALGGNQLSGCMSEGLWNVRNNDLSRLDLLSCGPDVALDKAALVALYNATDGANWTNNTNWLSYWPLGEWHGVTTDADGRVARLNLSANQLSGSIPLALDYLANLRALYLGDNQLSGCIPAGLRDLDGGENDLDRLGLFFCEVSSPDLTRPISPPEHMANIVWDWPHKFRVLEIDFTIHNDPGDFSAAHGLYLMLCQSQLSDVVFYFGLQTNAQRRGKGLVFSRWGTRDLANARVADAVEGWTQSSGHEGDFIGVRRAYDWGAGEYRVRFAPDGSEADGEWFGLWITNKARGTTTWIGSLKFPYLNGEAVLNRQSIYTTVEIYSYGVQPIRPIDIPEWRVSLKRPLGDGVKPSAATSNYSVFTGGILNSNVRYDPTDDVMHFQVGRFTERTDPNQQTIFD